MSEFLPVSFEEAVSAVLNPESLSPETRYGVNGRLTNKSRNFITTECLNMGQRTQNDFIDLCKKREWTVTRAPIAERSATYVQLYINRKDGFKLAQGQKEIVSVKIRSMTKWKRSDALIQDEWVCIELHGAEKDEDGWLYGGGWDLLAVQSRKGFLMVERHKLIQLVDRCIDRNTETKNVVQSKYILYGRKQRMDVITHIRYNLLLYIGMGTVSYPQPLEIGLVSPYTL